MVQVEDDPPGLEAHVSPVVVELVGHAKPDRLKQYSVTMEACKEIKLHIQRLFEAGILRDCQSPWNIPSLPVQKPGTNVYRLVQDSQAMNTFVVTLYPTVPDSYTLLILLPPAQTWYTVLDLKGAFFCISLSIGSQEVFAFEWEEPERQRKC